MTDNGSAGWGGNAGLMLRLLPGILPALLILTGCEQQIAMQRILPLDHAGSLRVKAARLAPNGDIVVAGETTARGVTSSGRKAGYPDLRGDLLEVSPMDGTASTVGFTGLRRAEGIAGSAGNPEELFLWSQEGARVSNDRGGTWNGLDTTLPFVGLPPGGIRTSRAGTFFLTSNFRDLQLGYDLLLRETPTAPWRQRTLPSGESTFSFISPLEPCFLVGTRLNMASEDCGATWKSNGNPPSPIVRFAIDENVPGLVYALGRESNTSDGGRSVFRVYRTEDGGRVWTALPFSLEEFPAMIVDPERAGVVYLVGAQTIWRGASRGAVWTQLPLSFRGGPFTTDFVRKQHYTFRSGEKAIYVVSSDLQTATPISLPQTVEGIPGIVNGKLYVSVRPVSDIFVARFRPGGEVVFYTEFGGAGEDLATSVDVFANGDILVSGSSDGDRLAATGRVGTAPLGFVTRISADGQEQRWLSRIPDTSFEEAYSSHTPVYGAIGPDGSVYLHASTADGSLPVTAAPLPAIVAGTRSYFLRLSGDHGGMLASAFTGSGNAGPIAVQAGGDAVIGVENGLIRISADATAVRWEMPVENPSQKFTALTTLPDGGLVASANRVARFVTGSPAPEQRGTIHRRWASGQPIAESLVGGTRSSSATAIQADIWGNILATGQNASSDMPLKSAVEMHDSFTDAGYFVKFDAVLRGRIYSTTIRGFRPASILSLGPSEWLLAGTGLRLTDRPNPRNEGFETITFVRVTESASSEPRLDRIGRAYRPSEYLGDRYFLPGGAVTLAGKWSTPDTTVSIDGEPAPAEVVDTGNIRLVLPGGLSSGYHTIRIHTESAVSNALTFPVP